MAIFGAGVFLARNSCEESLLQIVNIFEKSNALLEMNKLTLNTSLGTKRKCWHSMTTLRYYDVRFADLFLAVSHLR